MSRIFNHSLGRLLPVAPQSATPSSPIAVASDGSRRDAAIVENRACIRKNDRDFGQKLDENAVLASPNVGQIVTTSTGPRVIWFALKVNF